MVRSRPSSFHFLVLFTTTTIIASVMSLSSTPKSIVVVGGGIQGTSVAFHLAQRLAAGTTTTTTTSGTTTITLLESKEPAAAASGKGGGFMARGWGDGTPTQKLHELAFDLYPSIAKTIGCTSYRKLPVLSVTPAASSGRSKSTKNGNNPSIEEARKKLGPIMPSWLDGSGVGRIGLMGQGDDTAQVTPHEFVTKMIAHAGDQINVVLGTCTGIETEVPVPGSGREEKSGDVPPPNNKVTGVKYVPRGDTEEQVLPADAVIVSAGPWSCAAEDWFPGAMELPMEGIKSTSIVWKKPNDVDEVDATALFCGEDDRFGTHLEVYPRPDGTIYLCGIGGSNYITKDELKDGAFREVCDANELRVDAARQSFQSMSDVYQRTGELAKTQACMRPCPPDAMPYMGKVPGYEGAYMNAGHNCWGIAWAPACGVAMSELVLDGKSKSINLAPFDPARFTPTNKRGGRGRKQKGTSVGEQW